VGALAVAKAVSLVEPSGLLAANLAGVAAFVFVAVPDGRLRRRGEGWDAYGLPWASGGLSDPATRRAWGRGALAAAATCAVVFPAFALAFWGFSRVLPSLPAGLAEALAPYGPPGGFRLRAPSGLAWQVPVQLLVVAVPEELFYRGWIQTSWARTRPDRGARVLGARLGAGFVATQALFALGHLVVWRPWRLGTFFPGLLFGWLRERTGSLVAPVLVHAASNLFLATLEASFYGG
jgi:membrane protease YdiL (CAAX protease family)